MTNKILGIVILFSLLVVGAWCLTFKAYYEASDEVAGRLSLGDWPGALTSLKNYQKNWLSYPVYDFAKLEKYRLRLNYLEGVVYHDAGNFEAATSSFLKAAESKESAMAAAAKYNLACYAMKEDGLNKAQALLNEALTLNPFDVGAKINLELVLKKIQDRQKTDLPGETEKRESKPRPEPGEQWRLDVPDEEGEGSGASSGRSFL